MAVVIPDTPYRFPKTRILIKERFLPVASGSDGLCVSSGQWAVLSEPSPTSYGFELIEIKRRALPEIGSAAFRFCAGSFPGVTATDAPDMHRMEVRIQMSIDDGDSWKTVFWGHVDLQEDQMYPGASVMSGNRVYRVVDGFARTLKWILDRCGYDGGTACIYGSTDTVTLGTGPGAYGHPGYNYQLQTDGPLLGNKSPAKKYERNGTLIWCHTWQGALSNPTNFYESVWTEHQMIDHACAASRPDTEPEFRMRGVAADNYDTFSPQGVHANESVWDFVARVVNRKRGYGIVFVDWKDVGTNGEDLEVYLSVSSIVGETISYQIPGQSGQTGSITGATSAGTSYQFNGVYALDLEGDHRNIDAMFRYSDAETNVHDLVETLGEQIEVAVTLCGYDAVGDNVTALYSNETDCLSLRYSQADVAAFVAQEYDHRTQPYWSHVHQAFGLPRVFYGTTGNGNGGQKHRIDYRCDDAGEIIGNLDALPYDTPTNTIEIMGSLPFYEGYKYTGTKPERTDGSLQYGVPQRRSPMVIARTDGFLDGQAGGDYWLFPTGEYPQDLLDAKINPASLGTIFQPSLTIHPDGILCQSPMQMGHGLRIFGNPAVEGSLGVDFQTGAVYPVTRLAFTVSLRLPWRVRLATWRSDIPEADRTLEKVRRRRVSMIENCHLWLAADSCIYDLNGGAIDPLHGIPPLRNALGATATAPGLLRDDRALLARLHQLSAHWYLYPRRRLSFGMSYCGLFDFTFDTDKTGRHPILGEYISKVKAGGKEIDVGTVVTAIDYDHQRGTTMWQTDWFNLELRV